MLVRGTDPIEETIGEGEKEAVTFTPSFDTIEKLQADGFKIGTVICRATRPRGAELIPLFWGVITRYERMSPKPIKAHFINSLGEESFLKEELVIIYRAIPYNIHQDMITKERQHGCSSVVM